MRRILILSDTFYPDPMVASVRITQWCRHLPEYGWQPIVLTRHRGYEATAEQLAKHVHPQLLLQYLNSPPAVSDAVRAEADLRRTSLRSLVRRFGAAVSVPDHTVIYWRRVRAKVLAAIEKYKPDVIFTTSPPHGIHTIGRYLARQTGIPWVADYRDPHVIDRRFQPTGLLSPLEALHRRFERGVYRSASLVVHAIPLQHRFARMFYPEAQGKIAIIENGVPAELLRMPASRAKEPAAGAGQSLALAGAGTASGSGVFDSIGRRKSIRVVGSIDPLELGILADAVLTLLELGIDCELKVVGGLIPAMDAIRRELGDRIVCTGYLRHEEALRQVQGADVLVSYNGRVRRENLQLTSKLFEFLATDIPVLVFNPTKPDTHLLRGVHGVRILKDARTDDIIAALQDSLLTSPRPLEDVNQFRDQYSRAHQVERLVAMLDKLVAGQKPGM